MSAERIAWGRGRGPGQGNKSQGRRWGASGNGGEAPTTIVAQPGKKCVHRGCVGVVPPNRVDAHLCDEHLEPVSDDRVKAYIERVLEAGR